MNRREFHRVAWCAAGLMSGLPAARGSSEWTPSRPVKLVVPAAPGSVPDATARPFAEQLGKSLGQPVVVENRPGAGGIVGMDAVARSAPDGHTIGLATQSQMVFNSHLFDRLPFQVSDVQPVLRLGAVAMVLAAHPDLPVATLPELVRLSRGDALPLQYAVPPLGTPPHVLALLLQAASGMKLDAVPFKGSAEAVAATVAGEVRLVLEAPPVVAPQVKAGRLKALAVTGGSREPLLPDVPTVREVLGQPFSGETWFGLVVPKGTTDDVTARLLRDARTALQRPELRTTYERFGWRPIEGSSPAEFAATVADEGREFGRLIRAAGVRLGT